MGWGWNLPERCPFASLHHSCHQWGLFSRSSAQSFCVTVPSIRSPSAYRLTPCPLSNGVSMGCLAEGTSSAPSSRAGELPEALLGCVLSSPLSCHSWQTRDRFTEVLGCHSETGRPLMRHLQCLICDVSLHLCLCCRACPAARLPFEPG